MHAPANREWLLDSIRGLHCYSVADACLRDLERIALDQYLAGRGRPRAVLRHELADANVAVVFNYKKDQVAPLHWPSFDLPADRAARLRVTHFGILQNC